MRDTSSYPPNEFEADFDAYQDFPHGKPGFQRAKVVFSLRYPDRKRFAYRFNRFWCVIIAIESGFPALVQDRIASPSEKPGESWLPENLLFALHEWYCGCDEATMRQMPKPDWKAVMEIYDRLNKPQ